MDVMRNQWFAEILNHIEKLVSLTNGSDGDYAALESLRVATLRVQDVMNRVAATSITFDEMVKIARTIIIYAAWSNHYFQNKHEISEVNFDGKIQIIAIRKEGDTWRDFVIKLPMPNQPDFITVFDNRVPEKPVFRAGKWVEFILERSLHLMSQRVTEHTRTAIEAVSQFEDRHQPIDDTYLFG